MKCNVGGMLPIRQQQWAKYTNGKVTAGMKFEAAFKEWGKLMKLNSDQRKLEAGVPKAQLAEFLRDSPSMSNMD